jgi:hypothetical protein
MWITVALALGLPALLLTACAPQPIYVTQPAPSAYAPPRAETFDLGTTGVWRAQASIVDGRPVCTIGSRMDSGAEVFLSILEGGVHLMFVDPGARLTAPSYRVASAIDGRRYDGTGFVLAGTGGTTLIVEDLSDAFLRDFIGGRRLTASFADARWTVDLTGSMRATRSLAQCQEVINRA